jgi:hypothetical protein
MAGDEAELMLYFTNGTASIERLNKLRAEREEFCKGMEILPTGKPYVIVKQIDDEMIRRIMKSKNEVGPQFPALQKLLAQELSAWTNLKVSVSEAGITPAILGYIKAIRQSLDDQKALVPEVTGKMQIELFLETMRKAAKMRKR